MEKSKSQVILEVFWKQTCISHCTPNSLDLKFAFTFFAWNCLLDEPGPTPASTAASAPVFCVLWKKRSFDFCKYNACRQDRNTWSRRNNALSRPWRGLHKAVTVVCFCSLWCYMSLNAQDLYTKPPGLSSGLCARFATVTVYPKKLQHEYQWRTHGVHTVLVLLGKNKLFLKAQFPASMPAGTLHQGSLVQLLI